MASSIENLRILLESEGSNVSDEVLNLYLSRATSLAKRYCKVSDDSIPEGLNNVIEDIALFKYRKKGVEAIQSESKGSLSESYILDIPPDILRELNQYRKIGFV